jgi:hypothetical protein
MLRNVEAAGRSCWGKEAPHCGLCDVNDWPPVIFLQQCGLGLGVQSACKAAAMAVLTYSAVLTLVHNQTHTSEHVRTALLSHACYCDCMGVESTSKGSIGSKAVLLYAGVLEWVLWF